MRVLEMKRSSKRLFWWLPALALMLFACRARAATVDFNRDIRPILSENCFQCHGPDASSRQANLRLDVESEAKADLGGYAAIVSGEPDQSLLLLRASSSDDAERMPPAEVGKKLSGEEIELLRRWIATGATWSRAWSYIPPRKRPNPVVSDDAWPRNWIDYFVLSRLEAEGVQPAPEADAITLARRLSFDLVGLPPRPQQVDRLARAPAADAYENLVDELLASEHFGERMAMYWLDLVRFADTVGYHGDQTHAIWPYRDYVIYSFNENKPLDEFTREQLAGDLLPNADTDQLIATGYNRLLQTSHEGGVQLKEYRAIYMADRVRNVSQVWMAATMGCAQCHDHKYDPITMRDFYAMGAFFTDIDDEHHLRQDKGFDGNRLPTPRLPEMEVLSIYQRQQLDDLDRKIAELENQGDKAAATELRARRAEIAQNTSRTMVSSSSSPRDVRLLPRGNWLDESGPIIGPAVPAFLGSLETQQRASRLDLAIWLTDTERGVGGLTARVMVNRFWYLLFGEGLAPVLDDFGGQGRPPTHPELLDQLAIEFVDSGWDAKHMLKLIVMSSTYRQSSQTDERTRARDPLNRLLARQARFRLHAESVRDAALAIAGRLETTIGGRSIKPYQPAGYYQHLNFPTRKYQPDTGSELWKRSVYMHWQRQFLHPMLKALDAPTREECTAQRQRSNTALAALTLLNDPIYVEAARCFAERILREAPGVEDQERLGFAFRQAVSRYPDPQESALLVDLLARSRGYYGKELVAAADLVSVGVAPNESEQTAELAAWTTVARAILNMSETTTRN